MTKAPQKRSRKRNLKVELDTHRFEDMSPAHQRFVLETIKRAETQRRIGRAARRAVEARKAREELEKDIRDLGVDCTPEEPDWEALFKAYKTKYGPGARPRGGLKTSPDILEQLVADFLSERGKRACAQSAAEPCRGLCPPTHSRRCLRAIDAICRELVQQEPWVTMTKKGVVIGRRAESLRDMLTEARKIPHLRDLVNGTLTPDLAKQLKSLEEIFLSEIKDDYFRKGLRIGARVTLGASQWSASHARTEHRASSRDRTRRRSPRHLDLREAQSEKSLRGLSFDRSRRTCGVQVRQEDRHL